MTTEPTAARSPATGRDAVVHMLNKVLCTTVGETFADYLNETLGFGLTNTTLVMGVAFLVFLAIQFRAPRYVPWIYWTTVVLIRVSRNPPIGEARPTS